MLSLSSQVSALTQQSGECSRSGASRVRSLVSQSKAKTRHSGLCCQSGVRRRLSVLSQESALALASEIASTGEARVRMAIGAAGSAFVTVAATAAAVKVGAATEVRVIPDSQISSTAVLLWSRSNVSDVVHAAGR